MEPSGTMGTQTPPQQNPTKMLAFFDDLRRCSLFLVLVMGGVVSGLWSWLLAAPDLALPFLLV